MSTIGSTRTRITGMSGFDTETMVRQLMNAESLKLNQLKQKSQLLTWQQEAFRGVTTSLKTFQDTFLSFTNMTTNFRSDTMFSALKVSVTGSSGSEMKGVSVKSTSGAQNTTATLKIDSFAAKDTYVGNTYNTAVASKTEADTSSLKAGDSFDITVDGRKETITLAANSFGENGKLDITALNEQLEVFGMDGNIAKARFEENSSGALVLRTTQGHSISISDNSKSPSRSSITLKEFDPKEFTKANAEMRFSIGDEDFSLVFNAQNNIQDLDDVVKKLNNKFEARGLTDTKASIEDGKIKFTFADNEKVTIKANSDDMKNLLGADKVTTNLKTTVQALGFASGATNTDNSSDKLSDVFGGFYTFPGDSATLKINGKEISVSKNDTIDDFVKKVNESEAGVTMKFSKITNSFRIESNEMGSINKINFAGSSDGFVENALGFKDTAESRISKASDAVVLIDGKQIVRSSNTFDISEGLSVTLDPGVQSTGETMTIKATPDTESTITNIKKFIEEYNKLLEGLTSQYNEKREKSSTYEYYEPLTDEQRDAMSEKDIEKWEAKAKTGILNNDSTIGKIITDLRSWVADGVDLGDGKKISLYELGIDSTNWRDLGKLSIVDEDKLKKALDERPDDVAKLFNKTSDKAYSDKAERATRMKEQGLANRINDIIENSIKTTYDSDGHRGTLIEKAGMKNTASDMDNILYDALKDQDDRIYQMIQKLNDKENNYYNMFSAMEKAMNKYNSQSSWLSQQFA